MMIDRRNHLNAMDRSSAGRMGRGDDAFSAKEARWWIQARERVQAIVSREAEKQMNGAGRDTLSYPIHMTHVTLSARKF